MRTEGDKGKDTTENKRRRVDSLFSEERDEPVLPSHTASRPTRNSSEPSARVPDALDFSFLVRPRSEVPLRGSLLSNIIKDKVVVDLDDEPDEDEIIQEDTTHIQEEALYNGGFTEDQVHEETHENGVENGDEDEEEVPQRVDLDDSVLDFSFSMPAKSSARTQEVTEISGSCEMIDDVEEETAEPDQDQDQENEREKESVQPEDDDPDTGSPEIICEGTVSSFQKKSLEESRQSTSAADEEDDEDDEEEDEEPIYASSFEEVKQKTFNKKPPPPPPAPVPSPFSIFTPTSKSTLFGGSLSHSISDSPSNISSAPRPLFSSHRSLSALTGGSNSTSPSKYNHKEDLTEEQEWERDEEYEKEIGNIADDYQTLFKKLRHRHAREISQANDRYYSNVRHLIIQLISKI